MKQYKFQTGTNEKIFDVLTIEDDGRMSLEWHGTDRVLRYEGVELRERGGTVRDRAKRGRVLGRGD